MTAPHADQAVVLHDAAVQYRVVADAHPGTDANRELGVDVDGDAVLDVGADSNLDRLGLGAQRGAVPDAGPGGEGDLTDHTRIGRDPRFGVQLRRATADGDDQRLRHGRHVIQPADTKSPKTVDGWAILCSASGWCRPVRLGQRTAAEGDTVAGLPGHLGGPRVEPPLGTSAPATGPAGSTDPDAVYVPEARCRRPCRKHYLMPRRTGTCCCKAGGALPLLVGDASTCLPPIALLKHSNALIDLAITRWRHADTATQVVAQVAAGAETGEPGDLVDRQIARLEEFAGAVDARLRTQAPGD